MSDPIGATRWAIAEGWIPSQSTAHTAALESHETLSVLNAGDRDAQLLVTVFFHDREPAGPYRLTVPARRTRHFRFNELDDPEPVPRDTEYASLIESDVPVVCQHTRLNSRQSALALMSTMAYAGASA